VKKLGLDLGNRSLGIAISDEFNFLARGLETYRFEDKDFKDPLSYTINLIETNKIDVVVLGLPKNMDGSIGEQAQICQDFKKELELNSNATVVLWDERLTSKMASNMMIGQNLKRKKRKKDIDKMAAVIILQGYLDSRK
jgi:putative Holliday junction resolvase